MNAPAASILVVDDEPDLRTLYELTLLREGYRVETASSVREARDRVHAPLLEAPAQVGHELLRTADRVTGRTADLASAVGHGDHVGCEHVHQGLHVAGVEREHEPLDDPFLLARLDVHPRTSSGDARKNG